jgi:hypothetical protein
MFSSLIAVVVFTFALAHVQADDAMVRQMRPLSSTDFDEIIINGALDVHLTQLTGDDKKTSTVEVETTNDIHDHIVVEIKDKHILSIASKGAYTTKQMPKIYIQFSQALRRYAVKGAGETSTEGKGLFNDGEDKFLVEKEGASTVSLKIDVNEFELLMSGAGSVELSGKVRQQSKYRVKGAGEVDASKLLSTRATIKIDGAATLRVAATDDIDIKSTGVSKVYYQLPEDKKPSKLVAQGLSKIERLSA